MHVSVFCPYMPFWVVVGRRMCVCGNLHVRACVHACVCAPGHASPLRLHSEVLHWLRHSPRWPVFPIPAPMYIMQVECSAGPPALLLLLLPQTNQFKLACGSVYSLYFPFVWTYYARPHVNAAWIVQWLECLWLAEALVKGILQLTFVPKSIEDCDPIGDGLGSKTHNKHCPKSFPLIWFQWYNVTSA